MCDNTSETLHTAYPMDQAADRCKSGRDGRQEEVQHRTYYAVCQLLAGLLMADQIGTTEYGLLNAAFDGFGLAFVAL